MDFFKDLEEIRESFKKFASLLPKDGTLVINSSIDDIDFIKEGLDVDVRTFGLDPEKSDYCAVNIENDNIKGISYDLTYKGEFKEHIVLCVPGIHNIYNSLAAVATCDTLDISYSTIKESLSTYSGCDRRFQVKGEVGGITIIDDYAHHPDEIRATLEVLKEYKKGTTWCIFQPHTYTRTNAFLENFAKALSPCR